MAKKVKDIRNKVIKDIVEVNDKYLQEFPYKTIITRDYYRKEGKYKEGDYNKEFGSFDELKKEAFGDELKIIDYKKKLHVLGEQVNVLEKQNKSLIKNSVTEERLLNLYVESIENETDFKVNNNIIKFDKDKGRKAVLQICDWHIGEIVKAESVNGVNEYNEEICLRRLDTTFNVFIAYCKKFNVSECHVLINGDIISGGIHEELIRNMWLNEVEQLFFAQTYFIKKLEMMSNHFNKITVDVIIGNHARVLQGRPYFKDKVSLNFEYLMGKNIQNYFDLLREKGLNKKIEVNVPESPFMIKEINGVKFLETHGDILSGGGGGGFAGIPFYSICMSSSKLYGVLHQLSIKEDTQFHHILCGHLHTTTKVPLFNGGYCFVGGCGIGTNEFSLFKMKSVAKKEQLMLIISKDGFIEMEKNIFFD